MARNFPHPICPKPEEGTPFGRSPPSKDYMGPPPPGAVRMLQFPEIVKVYSGTKPAA